jgi:hypothetical protein
MNNEIQFELCILTNDGWIVSLVTDKPIMLGDVIIKSIVVQPKEDYAKRIANDPNTPRSVYRINGEGTAVYE